ncbi:MAG: lamin tail domain-containing protein [Labilithrix sp.]|nr:lamin tail domain-containing protein [Labilithrix sp.]MCW5813981.1 lamin tail domain-containing protein [Labilithrix sp.]
MSKLIAATVLLGSLTGSAMLFTAGCMSQTGSDDVGSATLFGSMADADAGPPPVGAIVISEAYGSGGLTGASFKDDFVELFNRTASPIALDGLSLQIDNAPSNATTNFTKVVALTGTIPANGYFLVSLKGSGNAGEDLPTPDQVVDDYDLGAKDGKVALVPNVTPLNCGGSGDLCATSKFLDLVGWGATSQQEGSSSVKGIVDDPGGTLASKKSAARKNKGCTESNNNAADFEVISPPTPQNSDASFTCPVAPRDAGPDADAKAPAPPIEDPDLGPESPFDAGAPRDAGAPSAAQGASDDCAVGAVGGPSFGSFAPLAGLALAVLAVRRRRSRA